MTVYLYDTISLTFFLVHKWNKKLTEYQLNNSFICYGCWTPQWNWTQIADTFCHGKLVQSIISYLATPPTSWSRIHIEFNIILWIYLTRFYNNFNVSIQIIVPKRLSNVLLSRLDLDLKFKNNLKSQVIATIKIQVIASNNCPSKLYN